MLPRPDRLRFHQATMDLLGQVPAFSDVSRALLARQAQRCGLSFPAAMREWYAIEDAVALLGQYSNQDSAVPLEQLGEELAKAGSFAGERSESSPVVVIQEENQGNCRWGVLLDGSEDPPVLAETSTGDGDPVPPKVWQFYSEHFSTFVYTRVWDWSAPCWDRDACHLEARDQPLTPADLAYLQQQFTEAPRTYGWPATTIYRFAGDDVRLLIWDRDDPVTDAHPNRLQHAYWMLWATGPATLTRLVEQVQGCGTLLRELFGVGDCGEAVVRQLFPGRPNPWATRHPSADSTDVPF
jgi:hypothetical protein